MEWLQWIGQSFTSTALAIWALLLSGYGLAILLLPRILSEQRTAGGAWAWLLVVFLVPHVGVVAYLLFGGRHLAVVTRYFPDLHTPMLEGPTLEGPLGACAASLARHGGAPVLGATAVRVIGDGVEAFEAVTEMIRDAKERVDISIFILYQDEVGRAFVDLLASKARQGVEVRLLVDAFGNLLGLKRPWDLLRVRSFTRPIKEAGGRVATFLPMLPRKGAWSVNMRNHRKMVLVDDRRAMLGGMNFGLEYMGPAPSPGRWKDLITIVEGPVVSAVQTIFEEDWHIATGRHRDVPVAVTPAGCEDAPCIPVQILADGPAFYEDAFAKLVRVALKLAQERIVLVTPYFVPDQSLQAALIATAHAGVRVELLLPAVSNHSSADWARRPFLRELVDEGVAVLLYQPGMVHAKGAVIDGRLAWISSANMDMRSITLNFEIAAVFYDADCARQLLTWYEGLASEARPVTREELRSGRGRRLIEGVLQLLSPLI